MTPEFNFDEILDDSPDAIAISEDLTIDPSSIPEEVNSIIESYESFKETGRESERWDLITRGAYKS